MCVQRRPPRAGREVDENFMEYQHSITVKIDPGQRDLVFDLWILSIIDPVAFLDILPFYLRNPYA